jgi:hypothetical protein
VARRLADENFPLPVVEELRRLGHDVATVLDAGIAGQGVSDADVLEYAVGQDRAVLTLNRKHFIQLHRQRPDHAGIVVCTTDRHFIAQAHRVHQALDAEPDLANRLIRVNRPGPGSQSAPDAPSPP